MVHLIWSICFVCNSISFNCSISCYFEGLNLFGAFLLATVFQFAARFIFICSIILLFWVFHFIWRIFFAAFLVICSISFICSICFICSISCYLEFSFIFFFFVCLFICLHRNFFCAVLADLCNCNFPSSLTSFRFTFKALQTVDLSFLCDWLMLSREDWQQET